MSAQHGADEFFREPLGGSIASSAKGPDRPKTLTDTNMTHGNHLPYPKTFEIYSVGLHYDKTANDYELEAFKEHASFQLRVSSKVILDLPLAILEDLSKCKNMGCYQFAEVVTLSSNDTFHATITYNGPKKSTISFRVRCVMQGFFLRQITY